MLSGIFIVEPLKVDKFKTPNLNSNFCCRYYIWTSLMNKTIVLFLDIMNIIRHYIIGSCRTKNKKTHTNESGLLKIISEHVFFLPLLWPLPVYWFMNYIAYHSANLIFNCSVLHRGGWGLSPRNSVLGRPHKNFNLKNAWRTSSSKAF